MLTPLAVTIASAVEPESSPAAIPAGKGSARLESRPGGLATVDSRVKFAEKSEGRGVAKLDSFAEKLRARVGKPVEKLVERQVSGPVSQPVAPVASSDWAQFAAAWQEYESAMAAKWGALSAPGLPSKGGSAVSPGVAAGEQAGEPG